MRKLMFVSALALAISSPALATPNTQAAPAATGTKSAVAEKIRADWPKYDVGAKGHLTRTELAKWLADLRVAAGQPAPDPDWQKNAFVQTDTNNDTKISLDELTGFLSGGA